MNTIKSMSLSAFLALVLVTALGAASASASELVSEQDSVTYLKGTSTTNHYFGFGGGVLSCAPQGFAGTSGKFAEEFGTSSVSNYLCGGGSEVKMNGCQLSFNPGHDISGGAGTKFGGSFDIGPAGCGPITINAGGCSTSFYPKDNLAAEFENVGSGATSYVKLHLNAAGLKYTMATCGGTTKENGSYSGEWLLKGYKNAGATEQVGLHVEDRTVGVFMIGKESAEESAQPKLDAEFHPVELVGGQDTQHVLTVNSRTMKCTGVELDSTASAATSDLAIEAAYSGCTFSGLASTVSMNSCHYTLHIANAGPPYTGTMGVACAKEGDAIEIDAAGVCKVKIAGQAGVAGASLANVGAGTERGVSLSLGLKGVKATVSGPLLTCGTNGLRDGAYSGASILYGRG